MGELESFLNSECPGIDPLIRAGLSHLQFETVHPFLDGNGRVGRLLIALLLNRMRLSFQEPMLYLSLYFKATAQMYYDPAGWRPPNPGDWEAWLDLFP